MLTELPAEIFERLQASPQEARRLFHGRGKTVAGLEALVIDWYPPVLLVTLHAEPPAGWIDTLTEHLLGPLQDVNGQALLLQRRDQHKAPCEVLWGECPEEVTVREAGLRYRVYPGRAQNPGLFLDMAAGRDWIRTHGQGKRILNLFAYTCAFSVAARAGGAERVVNVDMNGSLLNHGRENHRLNGHDLNGIHFLAHNLFKSWGKIRRLGPYDMVICDPPTLQRGSFDVRRDYARVLRRLPEWLPNGGEVLACLNAPDLGCDFLREQIREACPQARWQERLAVGDDFPEADPEAGLKVIRLTMPSSATVTSGPEER